MELRADLDHGLDSRWSQVLYVESSQLTDEPTVYMWESAVTSVENESNLFLVWNAHRTHPFPPPKLYPSVVWVAREQCGHAANASELRRGTVQAKAYARSLCHCEHLYLCADVVELAIISEVCKANASELIKGTVQPKLAPMLSEKEIQYLQQTNQCSWRIVLKFY